VVPHADERVRDEGAEEDIRAEYGGNIMMMMMMMMMMIIIKELQKTAILGTAHILRKVLM
jgi:hypothetical protein